MRVLHINCNYVRTTLHQNMIEHLERCGIENEVFVPVYTKENFVIQVNKYVTVSKCFKKNDRMVFFLKQKKIFNSLEKEYDINKFDIIHAYTLFTDGNCAYELHKKYGIPYVVTIRNTDVNAFFKYMHYLRSRGIEIMRNASAVIFLSKSYLIQVLEKYVPEKYKNDILQKTHIIPNGIDDFWLKNKYLNKNYNEVLNRINEKKINLVYAGVIDKNKNIEHTVKAITKLKEDGWKINFNVIGKIKDKKLFEKIKKYNVINHIEPQIKENLINYYRQADIFVMPSHKETFGLVYAEAMSQALPVIYTRGQGFDKQFDEGLVGYHVSDKKIEEIVNAITNIKNNYRVISNNSVTNCEVFDWDSISKEYFNLYIKMINNGK